jgi:hypothetical protein
MIISVNKDGSVMAVGGNAGATDLPGDRYVSYKPYSNIGTTANLSYKTIGSKNPETFRGFALPAA